MLKIGIKGEEFDVVSESNCAKNVGSGRVTVFATPMMIALMEKAAALSVEPFLEKGQSSVGTEVNVSHISATPSGMKVRAESELVEIDGRKLTFKVMAFDERGLIGEGVHSRFIINTEKFQLKANEK